MKQQFSGFYKLSIDEKYQVIEAWLEDENPGKIKGLPAKIGSQMVENYLGNYEMPLGLAVNVTVNHKDYIVPMAIEEPSVIAAVCKGGKILGNIHAETDQRYLVGQIIMYTQQEYDQISKLILDHQAMLLEKAKSFSSSMVKRGGGPIEIWSDCKVKGKDQFVSIYLSFNPCDAMGANVLNTVLENLAPEIEKLMDGSILMRILSNYQEEHMTRAKAEIPLGQLNPSGESNLARKIELASSYAELDVYRATTHNKGVMNGIDAVLIATGNDWRAIEAGVHAYACRQGKYQPLTNWYIDTRNNNLVGEIELPLAVATIGGTISTHPTAQWALKLLRIKNAKELANLVASLGLIQNFAALRALVDEGIQKGHMSMHSRALAVQVGAKLDEIPKLVELLKQEKIINRAKAAQILEQIRKD